MKTEDTECRTETQSIRHRRSGARSCSGSFEQNARIIIPITHYTAKLDTAFIRVIVFVIIRFVNIFRGFFRRTLLSHVLPARFFLWLAAQTERPRWRPRSSPNCRRDVWPSRLQGRVIRKCTRCCYWGRGVFSRDGPGD